MEHRSRSSSSSARADKEQQQQQEQQLLQRDTSQGSARSGAGSTGGKRHRGADVDPLIGGDTTTKVSPLGPPHIIIPTRSYSVTAASVPAVPSELPPRAVVGSSVLRETPEPAIHFEDPPPPPPWSRDDVIPPHDLGRGGVGRGTAISPVSHPFPHPITYQRSHSSGFAVSGGGARTLSISSTMASDYELGEISTHPGSPSPETPKSDTFFANAFNRNSRSGRQTPPGGSTKHKLDRSGSLLDLKQGKPKPELLHALDPTDQGVLDLSRVKVLDYFTDRHLASYNLLRSTYRYNRQSQRNDKPKSFIAMLLLAFDARNFSQLFWKIMTNPERIAMFMVLDLMSDLAMSILYLFELQWNFVHRDEVVLNPRWLWVSRPKPLFYTALALSLFNLFSFFCSVLLADIKIKALMGITALLGMDFFGFSVLTEKILVVVLTIATVIYLFVCTFQYAENNFSRGTETPVELDLMQSFYFIVVTLSTVGFGDITAKTRAGQLVVILLIFVALSVVPPIITSLIETVSLTRAGGGQFERGSAQYVVVVGSFDTTSKVIDILQEFLTGESEDRTLKVVILAREPPTPAIKMVIGQSLYKDRVTYLVGDGLEWDDMKRFHPETARAVYIIGNRFATDARKEDEENTLRAWAISDYSSQMASIYVANVLPETKLYQKRVADRIICIDEFKQVVMAHTTLCSGSAALLINLLHKYTPYDKYNYTWTALYGDGAGNEFYSDRVPSLFVGQNLNDVAWYLYHEFQVILIAVVIYSRERKKHYVVLNPGPSYQFGEDDGWVLIAQGPQEIDDIRKMTAAEYEVSLTRDAEAYSRMKTDCTEIGTPRRLYTDPDIPFCHVLKEPAKLEDLVIDNARAFSGHLVVCTRDFNVFQFVCAMRAAYLSSSELKPIVFVSTSLPEENEFRVLAKFPDVYYLVGDPKTERVLNLANVQNSEKVVIFNMATDLQDKFSDSSAIMISHLVHTMAAAAERPINVVVELGVRAHVRFLDVTGLKYNKRKRRKADAATRFVDENLGYLYKPMFAAGRVVVGAMLDCLLFQLSSEKGTFNPTVETFRLLAGAQLKKDVEVFNEFGLRSSYLKQIPIPSEFVGRRFSDLFRYLCEQKGKIAIGLFRWDHERHNKLQYVITNPLASLILQHDDSVFLI
ncbi:potassium channel, sub T, member 2 [Phlyctochytrium bullatum]|nr:potassium channel, sub T, member 2 [Phlyctochytrium bullatum]